MKAVTETCAPMLAQSPGLSVRTLAGRPAMVVDVPLSAASVQPGNALADHSIRIPPVPSRSRGQPQAVVVAVLVHVSCRRSVERKTIAEEKLDTTEYS